MRRVGATMLLAVLVAAPGCSGSDDARSDDRTQLSAESDDVRVEVADCFVVERDGDRRYQTTVEVHNESGESHAVAVTIVADLGRGGTSDPIEVPAGASDAWAVTAEATTDDPAGDAVCSEYVNAVEVTLDSVAG